MARVPRVLSEQSREALRLSPEEAAVVSRIDGRTSEQELATATGLSLQKVVELLDRMAAKGLVAFGPEKTAELVELDESRRRRVLDLFLRLEDLTYYELLGIPDQADKKQIKSAYYALAPEFHPDRYFRKNLGSYRQKIEAIFTRVTVAHDVLTSSKRGEYDEYLAQTGRSRRAPEPVETSSRNPTTMLPLTSAVPVDAVPASQEMPDPPPTIRSRPMTQAEALRERREALARKLMGNQRRTVPPPSGPSEPDPTSHRRAVDVLRQRHDNAVADARRAQLTRYLEEGGAALEKKDFAGAANAFRIAATLAPDDPAVQATCNESMRQAAAALAETYWKQAQHEAAQERWAEAALSFSKVCAGRPTDPLAHERVAHATLNSANSPRRAVEFARKAVELNPTSAEFRVTLARAYAAAGLDKSAQGELQRALELAPTDPKILALVAGARAASPKDNKLG